MRKMGWIGVAIVLALAVNATAQPRDSSGQSCLERLSAQVETGSRVRILLQDSSEVRGKFSAIDSLSQGVILRMRVKDTSVSTTHAGGVSSSRRSERTISLSEIVEIQYPLDNSRRKSIWICAAVVSGVALGVALAPPDKESRYPYDQPVIKDNKWKSGLIGGAAGLGIGVLLSLAVNRTSSLHCL